MLIVGIVGVAPDLWLNYWTGDASNHDRVRSIKTHATLLFANVNVVSDQYHDMTWPKIAAENTCKSVRHHLPAEGPCALRTAQLAWATCNRNKIKGRRGFHGHFQSLNAHHTCIALISDANHTKSRLCTQRLGANVHDVMPCLLFTATVVWKGGHEKRKTPMSKH